MKMRSILSTILATIVVFSAGSLTKGVEIIRIENWEWIDWFCKGCGCSVPVGKWIIQPTEPTPSDVITFCGLTKPFSNSCYFQEHNNGVAVLTIDDPNKVIELSFEPGTVGGCFDYWDPIYVPVSAQFGPLSEGDWLFFSKDRYTTFSIPFRVSWLKVLSPNGGESLIAGTTHTVRWRDFRNDANCLCSYMLEFSLDNGQNWLGLPSPIDPNHTSNTCAFDWLVPPIDSNQCLIRIVDANDPNVDDTSNAPFTMFVCTVKGDVTGDCLVNFADLAILVEDWLKCGNPFDSNCLK